MMYSARFHAMLVASLAAAGCSSGSGTSPAVPSVPPSKPNGSTYATFVVKIPPKPPQSGSRRRHYITSNVKGISFSVTDATTPTLSAFTFYPITASTGGCTGSVPSGITCTLDVVAPPGNDTFVVDLYDSVEVNVAYVISTGTVTAAITAQASNTINVVTDGVPTFAVMGLANPYPTTSGSSPLTIDVADPSGDLIVGSYDAPLNLSDTDTSGATTLSKTTLNQPSDTIGVSLNWNGAALASGASIIMSSTDGLLVTETGSATMTNALFRPGAVGPAASQGTYYFATASASAQSLNVVGQNGSAGPFVVSNSCAAFVTVSGVSPNFVITPTGTTAPASGGLPEFQTTGTCQFTVTDNFANSTPVQVMVGQ